MLRIEVPGREALMLEHLVCDYNGTLAEDGQLLDGLGERLQALSSSLKIWVITADTFGSVHRAVAGLPLEVHVLTPGDQDKAKQAFVKALGPQYCVAIGNGRNDALMLQDCALGMALIQSEGAAVPTLMAADVVYTSVQDALDGLLKPQRLVASLRL